MNRLRSSSLASASSRCADVGGVDDDVLLGPVGGVEAELLDDPLEDRVQPAGADVLGRSD